MAIKTSYTEYHNVLNENSKGYTRVCISAKYYRERKAYYLYVTCEKVDNKDGYNLVSCEPFDSCNFSMRLNDVNGRNSSKAYETAKEELFKRMPFIVEHLSDNGIEMDGRSYRVIEI